MKESLSSRRMEKNRKRNSLSTKLNLVSLMDIFTILVFFLMLNNGDVEVLRSDKDINLPKSTAVQKPGLSLMLKVSDTEVVLQGKVLGAIYASVSGEINERMLQELTRELSNHSIQLGASTTELYEAGYSVIIMGDEAMPYSLLKKLMTICADNNYRDISFAVNRIATVENQSSDELAEEVKSPHRSRES